MKKLLVFSMAALLVVAFSVPASALENVFGGYWRTRGYINEDFTGQKDSDQNRRVVDTRTRLYYTAILNDNLKLVNKFEFDAVWGGQGGDSYGDFGADGVNVEIKNSYADFNLGPINNKLGIQGAAIGRSIVFDNDFAGYVGTWKLDRMWFRGSWLKANDAGTGYKANQEDYEAVGLEASFSVGDAGSIRPYVFYSWSREFQGGDNMSGIQDVLTAGEDDTDLTWVGVDADFTLGSVGLWGSAGYVGGTINNGVLSNGKDLDISGYVFAVGGDVPLGPASIHGQFLYGSGDDDAGDNDLDAYVGLSGSYYWSEIMGYGTFDNQVSAGSPADQMGNLMFFNIGATMKPTDKLSISGDLWWAQLVEDEVGGTTFNGSQTGKDDLGVEIDLKLTYQLVPGMNLDIIGAYLFAGDATSDTAEKNDKDPWEVGWRTSLSF